MTVRISENATPLPSESAMRRALRRARDGASLDVTEATVLLCARGEHLGDLLASASRMRDVGLIADGRPGVITRPGGQLIGAGTSTPMRWRCSPPTVRDWTRSPAWPTMCEKTPSART